MCLGLLTQTLLTHNTSPHPPTHPPTTTTAPTLTLYSQSAFDTGAGVGQFVTYAAYSKPEFGLNKPAIAIPMFNNVVSLVSKGCNQYAQQRRRTKDKSENQKLGPHSSPFCSFSPRSAASPPSQQCSPSCTARAQTKRSWRSCKNPALRVRFPLLNSQFRVCVFNSGLSTTTFHSPFKCVEI